MPFIYSLMHTNKINAIFLQAFPIFIITNMVPELEKPNVTEIQVRIDCNGCVHKIKKALQRINGIYDIYIDIPQQRLTVIGWADPEKIVKAIKKTRKTATICSHTTPMESDSSPEDGASSSDPANRPGEETPPAEQTPPTEPPNPPPPPSTGSTTYQPPQSTGSTEVGEANVVYHHPPDHQDSVGVHSGWVDRYPGGGGHGGPRFKHELPQPIHVNDSYKPTPYITEYEYIRQPPDYTSYSRPEPPPLPPRYTSYSWPEQPQQYTHYSRPEPPQHYSRSEPPQLYSRPEPPQHHRQPGPPQQHYSQPGSLQQQNQTYPPQQQSQPEPPQHYRQPEPPKEYPQRSRSESTCRPKPPQQYTQYNHAEPPQQYTQYNHAEPPQQYTQYNRPEPPQPYTQYNRAEPPQRYTQYHRPEPPQPYTQYNQPEPPQQYTQYSRVEPSSLHTYYSRLEPPDYMHYNDDYHDSNMSDEMTSGFSDEDPNGCRIV